VSRGYVGQSIGAKAGKDVGYTIYEQRTSLWLWNFDGGVASIVAEKKLHYILS